MDAVEKTTTHLSAFTPSTKREIMLDDIDLHPRNNSALDRIGMTPSCNNNYFSWNPVPLSQPVVQGDSAPLFNDRQLDPLEWAELLEQTECLDYISPDIDECIERQSRMEGNQELELTGREFVDSPAILKLPFLNALSSAERPSLLKPIAQFQCGIVSRRPGLREHIPRKNILAEQNETDFKDIYPAIAEQLVRMRRPSKDSSAVAKRSADNSSLRSANRLLDFEASQHSNTRHKRASWGGRSARATTAPAVSRRECKSARKSKDCMIPGCTKGARSRGLCKRHGGGKRCTYSECSRSDQGGGFCIAHGGGTLMLPPTSMAHLTPLINDENQASGAPLVAAKTRLNLVDCAKAMEAERDVGLKDVPKVVKQEDFAAATNLKILFLNEMLIANPDRIS